MCLTGEVPTRVHRLGQGPPARAARPARDAAHADEVGRERSSAPTDAPGARRARRSRRRRSRAPAARSRSRCRGTCSSRTAPVALADAVAPRPRARARRGRDRTRRAALLGAAANPMIMVGGGALDGRPRRCSSSPSCCRRRWCRSAAAAASSRATTTSASRCAEGFERWARDRRAARHRHPARAAVVPLARPAARAEDRRHRHRPGAAAARRRRRSAIVGDAAAAARALLAGAARAAAASAPSRRDEFEAVQGGHARARSRRSRRTSPTSHAIRDVLPRDGFFVEEICQAGFASYFALPGLRAAHVRHARPPGHARLRLPDRARRQGRRSPTARSSRSPATAASCSGSQELATAVQYGLGVVTVLFNNSAYGNVLRDQQRLFDGRVLGRRAAQPRLRRARRELRRRAPASARRRPSCAAALDGRARARRARR